MPEALWYSVKASALNIKTHVGAFLYRIPRMPRWKRQQWRNPESLGRRRKIHTKHVAVKRKDPDPSLYSRCVFCCCCVVGRFFFCVRLDHLRGE